MPDRDVFTPLGRGWATVGRALASGILGPGAAALAVCYAIRGELKHSAGLQPLMRDLAAIILAARHEQEGAPLFASDPVVAYARRQEARDVCRRYRAAGVAMADVAEDAVAQVLVDQRQAPPKGGERIQLVLARAILIQIFEHRFAGKVEILWQLRGLSAAAARKSVEECRHALVTLPAFNGLVENVARRPEAKYRRIGLAGPKQTTAQLLNKGLGDLLSAGTGSEPHP